MSELNYLYNLSREWLLERWDAMFRVEQDKPEGEIKCKWWVERRERDAPTVQERIVSHFKNTSKKYQNHD
ncbi:hypothetical protein VPH184E373B_0184 [Vibrio phage 184E37-3b]|nr:hypothetical protein MYOV056v2_p0160 [Vibrio phage 184E37.3a]QZI90146.1 hypothetical protein MYOV057v1_p0231 [Vibrio phage 184E37.1]